MKRSIRWLFFVSDRFNAVDSRGRSALTGLLSTLGIAFGVTALIVILSVMNGFQRGNIESILEVSSAHVRLEGSAEDIALASGLPGVKACVPFTESQTLVQGAYGRQQGALLRGVPTDILARDTGFASAARVVAGYFDIAEPNGVVLGYELARMLSVGVGDRVSVVAVSGDSSTDLFPENATLTITGLFKTGYYAIDNAYAFVSSDTANSLAGTRNTVSAAVKLDNLDGDIEFLSRVKGSFPELTAESWRSYNRSFFSALRIEKTLLMLLVVLIFVVVTVNIYNAIRRSVYERREEICVLSALGGLPRNIQYIFLLNGFAIGITGACLGLLTGLLVSARINSVFLLAEAIVNAVNAFVSALLHAPKGAAFTLFSPEYFYIDEIPVRMLFPEILFVFLFGMLSAAAASWFASRSIAKLKPSEVLRYE
ncbi:MAG TPA: ABC transporter permease [Treponemataceae bacterium]|nr:ABC transporter permease [Treponemataceae bacterium]